MVVYGSAIELVTFAFSASTTGTDELVYKILPSKLHSLTYSLREDADIVARGALR